LAGVLSASLYTVRADDLDSQIAEVTTAIEDTKCWQESGIKKMCGIAIGATKEDLLKSGVLVETEIKPDAKRGIFTLKKPFRTMDKVELYFSKANRVCYMEFSGDVDDFTVGKNEFQSIFNMIVTKFGMELKRVPRYNEIGAADNNQENWIHKWTFHMRPDRKQWASYTYKPEVVLELWRKRIKLSVKNPALQRYDAALLEKKDLEKKKAGLRSADDGADVL